MRNTGLGFCKQLDFYNLQSPLVSKLSVGQNRRSAPNKESVYNGCFPTVCFRPGLVAHHSTHLTRRGTSVSVDHFCSPCRARARAQVRFQVQVQVQAQAQARAQRRTRRPRRPPSRPTRRSQRPSTAAARPSSTGSRCGRRRTCSSRCTCSGRSSPTRGSAARASRGTRTGACAFPLSGFVRSFVRFEVYARGARCAAMQVGRVGGRADGWKEVDGDGRRGRKGWLVC